MSKIKLLLVDDHEIVRAGLRMLFAAEPDMEIVGQVSSGDEAVQAAQTLTPDVIIMDVTMPGMDGIEATRQIKENSPDATVLALTMHEDEQYFFEMLHAGASGYVPKRAAPDDLVSAIRVVNKGNVFLHSTLAKFLMRELTAKAPQPAAPIAVDNLTPREKEVLTYIAEGYTNREIAEDLVISVKTVDRHRENIMQKLNLHNRVELVKYAIEKDFISLK